MTYRELKSFLEKASSYKLDQQIKVKYLPIEDRRLYVDKIIFENNEDSLDNLVLLVEQ